MISNLTLVVIYRLNCPPPEKQIELSRKDGRRAIIAFAGIEFQSSRMVTEFTSEGSAATLANYSHTLPPATYLVIEVAFLAGLPSQRNAASIEARGIAAAIEADQPALLAEKCVEEVMNPPGVFVASPEGPIKVTARPAIPPEDFTESLKESIAYIESLKEEDRNRFRLCSRWFWRAHETLNEIDKFLFFYISLEVFPSMDTSDVPGRVRDFIHANFFPSKDPATVKERLQLGKIAGLRADIAHDGISELGAGRVKDTAGLLEKLEVIVRATIRFQAGKSYDGGLDRWVNGDN